MPVVFHALVPVSLKQRKPLKLFINHLFKIERKKLQALDIIFCSDEYLLEINKQHLQHNFYTDIITFDLSDSPTSSMIGELYISIDRVRDNATVLNISFTTELLRVIFHGALHLCGYNDKKLSDTKIIRKKEDDYLKSYHNL